MNDNLFAICLQNPDEFVAQVTYIDSQGTVTTRAFSPYRIQSDSVLGFCFDAQALRSLKKNRILRVQVRATADVIAPEAKRILARHKSEYRRRQDNSTGTTASEGIA